MDSFPEPIDLIFQSPWELVPLSTTILHNNRYHFSYRVCKNNYARKCLSLVSWYSLMVMASLIWWSLYVALSAGLFESCKCPDVNYCFYIVLHIRKDSYHLTTTDPGNVEIGISESLISQKQRVCPPYTFKPFAVQCSFASRKNQELKCHQQPCRREPWKWGCVVCRLWWNCPYQSFPVECKFHSSHQAG